MTIMKTRIKHALLAICACLTLTNCDDIDNSSFFVTETYDPSDSTLIIWDGIYSGILPVNDSDEYAAIWLYNDSTYLLMTSSQDSDGDMHITEGFLTFDNDVLQIPTNDNTYYYYITTESDEKRL